MLKAIQTKILLAIVAVFLAIAGTLAYRQHEAEKAAFERQQEYERFRQQVEQQKKKHSSAAAHEGNTWKKYIP